MQIGFVDFYEQLLDFRKIGFCREFSFLHVTLEFRFELVHRLEEFGCIRPILTHILAVADSQQFFVLLVPAGDDASLLQNVKCCVIQSHKVHGVLIDMGSILLRFRMLMQTLYVGLIGHYSKNDELYITGYISSVTELHDAVPALRGGIDAAYDASLPEGIDIMKFPVFYTASNVQEAYKRVQQKIVSKIDDYFASEVKVRVSGIGFYTDILSNEKFVEFMRLHKAALTAPSAPIELRDIYENVVERHGRPEDFLVENSDFDCKASVIAYAMNNETILCAGQDIFDGMLGSKETDAENCSCVSVSDKEFARLHSKFGLKKEDVLEAIKAYAQELGLEYGPVNYFMMCGPKYANDLGEIVQ